MFDLCVLILLTESEEVTMQSLSASSVTAVSNTNLPDLFVSVVSLQFCLKCTVSEKLSLYTLQEK